MTFEEAKDILKKEGYELEKVGVPCSLRIAFTAYESPEICEAMQVVCSAGYAISIEMRCFNARKARLKKEYEKNTKAPNPAKSRIKGNFPGNKSIEYCGDPMPGPGEEQPEDKKGIIYPTTFPKADFYYKHVLNEGNPALKEAASQFNDALLDEQAKKIKRLGKEISKLNSIIHDKNAVLSDVAEELRLSKIREKNLTEVCQKYVKENDELREKLADKVVDKIDAQALKSAESALAWKEKTITYKDMALAYYEKKIAEKDDVIADLGKELAATKTKLKKKLEHAKKIRVSSDNAEEGAYLSGVFVLCGKDFIDALKNVKDVWQE